MELESLHAVTEDALPFPSSDFQDFHDENEHAHAHEHEHEHSQADEPEHSSTDAHATDQFTCQAPSQTQPGETDFHLARTSSEEHHDLTGSARSGSRSASGSPDHPPPCTTFYASPPAQTSAYSLIDPELHPDPVPAPVPALQRQQSWQTDYSEPSVDSGLASDSASASGEDGLPVFLTPDAPAQEEQEQVPPPKPKKSHARKQPPGHIPRARNAFILFRKHITDSNLIPPSVEIKHQNISVVAAKMWREAPADVRAKFQELARIEKVEHQRKYPGYRYQPVFRRTDIIRRRVRKEAHEDDKVEAVAELLMKGKAGSALEKEIKEQLKDRTGEDSDSGFESSTGSTGSRRRRTDAGQLSKGALRAQKAQSRARALRQSAYDAEMISLQQLNQSYNLGGGNGMPYAQDDAYLLDYGAQHAQRRSFHGDYNYDSSQGFIANGIYPPMQLGEGVDSYAQLQGRQWTEPQQPYYNDAFPDPTAAYQNRITDPAYFDQPAQYPPSSQYDAQPLAPVYPAGADYGGLPPANTDSQRAGQGFGVAPRPADIIAGQFIREVDSQLPDGNDQGEDPRMRWSREQLPTPSNHVSFQDDLFAGEGGIGLDRDLQEYVGAMEQAEHELPGGW